MAAPASTAEFAASTPTSTSRPAGFGSSTSAERFRRRTSPWPRTGPGRDVARWDQSEPVLRPRPVAPLGPGPLSWLRRLDAAISHRCGQARIHRQRQHELLQNVLTGLKRARLRFPTRCLRPDAARQAVRRPTQRFTAPPSTSAYRSPSPVYTADPDPVPHRRFRRTRPARRWRRRYARTAAERTGSSPRMTTPATVSHRRAVGRSAPTAG